MSDWFRGTLEAAFVGTPARAKREGRHPEFAAYDIRLYRASVAAVERIPEPPSAPAAAAAAAAAGPPKPSDPNAPKTLRQAEIDNVTFIGVGAEDASDLHAAYDLRVEDIEFTNSTEVDGRLYGRLTGRVVGSLMPTDAMKAAAARERKERKEQDKRAGTWVEALRWVFVIVGAWVAFGLCGTVAGSLWLGVCLFSMVTRVLLRSLVPATPAVRVLGWALVASAAGLSWLLYHRVTTVACASANWWLLGIAGAVLVSSILYSRYAFLCTKLVWFATLMSLCYASRTHHCASDKRPGTVSETPRTEPDGHWPRHPRVSAPPLEGIEARESAVRVSVAQAIAQGDAVWQAKVPVVIHIPLSRVIDAGGAVTPDVEMTELVSLLKAHPTPTVLVEVHGAEEEPTGAHANAIAEWLIAQGVGRNRLVARGAGASYPLLPTDGLGGSPELNRRVEVRIPRTL